MVGGGIVKNVISIDELFDLLLDWKDNYGIKKTHGVVTFVELKKEFSLSTLSVAGLLMSRLQKYYPYLSFECDNENQKLTMTIGVRKDSLSSFMTFNEVLKKCESKWQAEGMISA